MCVCECVLNANLISIIIRPSAVYKLLQTYYLDDDQMVTFYYLFFSCINAPLPREKLF